MPNIVIHIVTIHSLSSRLSSPRARASLLHHTAATLAQRYIHVAPHTIRGRFCAFSSLAPTLQTRPHAFLRSPTRMSSTREVDNGGATAHQPEENTTTTTTTTTTTKTNSKHNEKEARKAARLAQEKARMEEKAAVLQSYSTLFGTRPLICSRTHHSLCLTPLTSLGRGMAGRRVYLRGRVSTTRKKGKMAFMVIRDEGCSVQAIAAVGEHIPKEMIDYMGQIPAESIVDVQGMLHAVETPITGTTLEDVELHVTHIHTVSESLRVLPYTMEDASRAEGEEGVKVNLDTRLNCRWLDMRTPASNALFRLQSRICQYFREYLLGRGYVEIHTPKLINAPSEGGANVFRVQYFNRFAYLAQSPQLYKQMALQGDLPGVFEIAPVFRAENSNTHRHLTEFVGLDVEMRITEHYFEVLDMAECLFDYIFRHLREHATELEAVRRQHPFEPLVWQVSESVMRERGVGVLCGSDSHEEGQGSAAAVESTDEYGAFVNDKERRMLRIHYARCIALLNTVLEEKLSPTDDINTTNEKLLGGLVKARYGVDFFISDRFPSSARPFYTMSCPDDADYTNSYDIFIRGEEICSGAQRIHDAELLLERAKTLNVDLTPISDYVDAFRLGAWPHGGIGVGLERVLMLYLGLGNVRLASMFPRDPQRTTP